jgi:hypothetical protein
MSDLLLKMEFLMSFKDLSGPKNSEKNKTQKQGQPKTETVFWLQNTIWT